nr:PLP-dependent aminotransferase family protein [Mammaliicoccus sciuri]
MASYIRDKIMRGEWFYGMRIPSQRILAKQFNVNRVTVIKSIELLEAEGFVYTMIGSGTYVNNYLDEGYISTKWTEMMKWSYSSRSDYTVQLINKFETDLNYIHISKGELSEDLLPHLYLKNALKEVSEYIGNLSFGYNNGFGYNKLRKLIANRLQHEGINVTQNNILITSGALHAIHLLTTGFLSQNALVFSFTPSYIDSTHIFNTSNLKQIKIPYSNNQQFNKTIQKYHHYKDKVIYVESTFNNPTGQSLSSHSKENIIKLSSRHNIPVIEDDIYRDLWFEEKPSPPLKSFDNIGKVFYISSFSKTLAPALRIGWIAASEKVIEQLADIRMQSDYGSSILSQAVVYEMLKSGDYDIHLTRLRKILKDKQNFMLTILDKLFSTIATWHIPLGGFFIWIKFKDGVNTKKLFLDLLHKEKILLNPGFIYGGEENTIRLSYSYETTDNIEFALHKIHEYVKHCIDN